MSTINNASLIRNARVDLENRWDQQGNVLAHITINNQFSHTFDASSRISAALKGVPTNQLHLATQQLQDRLNHGSYFMVNDQLVDFRDGHYDGFMHTDHAIENLMEVIGVSPADSKIRSGMRLNTTVSDYMLTKRWSSENFDIAEYAKGGVFESNIIYNWNPFNSLVRGAFEIVRQVCTNGAIGTSELINTRVPIINRWEEHLRIANTQMQNKVQGLVKDRLSVMGRTRANVATMQLIHKHATERLQEAPTDEKNRLKQLIFVSDVNNHLKDFYAASVFLDNNLASRTPSHLTMFDAWNLATEMSSHTTEVVKSTTGGLQRLVNGLMFPAGNESERSMNITPLISPFSSPVQAFLGDTIH